MKLLIAMRASVYTTNMQFGGLLRGKQFQRGLNPAQPIPYLFIFLPKLARMHPNKRKEAITDTLIKVPLLYFTWADPV